MKLDALLTELHELQRTHGNPEVAVFSSVDGGDDVQDWAIVSIHTGWDRGQAGDTIALEIDFDQHTKDPQLRDTHNNVAVRSKWVADRLNEHEQAFVREEGNRRNYYPAE